MWQLLTALRTAEFRFLIQFKDAAHHNNTLDIMADESGILHLNYEVHKYDMDGNGVITPRLVKSSMRLDATSLKFDDGGKTGRIEIVGDKEVRLLYD